MKRDSDEPLDEVAVLLSLKWDYVTHRKEVYVAVTSLRDAFRWFSGANTKNNPLFRSEREAYDFCLKVYNETGGASDDLKRAFEFYRTNFDDDRDTFLGSEGDPHLSIEPQSRLSGL